MAKKFDRTDKKKVWSIDRKIEVDDNPTTLSVKVDLNTKDCTWKITANITTNQVDPNNDDVTQATIDTLHKMIQQAVEEAITERAKILDSKTDPNQQDLFEGSAAGPGNR